MEYPELENSNGRTGHIVINTKEDGGRFECEHCGADYTPALPCPMNIYLDIANGFLRDHKNCELRTENRMGRARLPPEEREEEEEEEEDEDEICGACNGSGEGMYDGSTCSACKGAGEKRRPPPEPDWDAMREAREENRAIAEAADDEVDWESPE